MKEKFKMDMHCHLNLYTNYTKLVTDIENNRMYCLIVTNKPSQYMQNKYSSKYVKYALGYHPIEIQGDYKKEIGIFLNELNSTRYIGEIGLDYTGKNIELQKDVFQIILRLISGKDKILSIHCRKAEKDLITYVSNFNGKIIIHWYSGNYINLKKLVDLGCYFSINNNMIKSKKSDKYFEIIPLDKILLESDAPYTSKFKKTYNCKCFIEIYDFLSKKYNISNDKINILIKKNFCDLLK